MNNIPFCALLRQTMKLKEEFIIKWGYDELEKANKISKDNFLRLFKPVVKDNENIR